MKLTNAQVSSAVNRNAPGIKRETTTAISQSELCHQPNLILRIPLFRASTQELAALYIFRSHSVFILSRHKTFFFDGLLPTHVHHRHHLRLLDADTCNSHRDRIKQKHYNDIKIVHKCLCAQQILLDAWQSKHVPTQHSVVLDCKLVPLHNTCQSSPAVCYYNVHAARLAKI